MKCKDCTERVVGCHAKCKDYQEFKKHRDDTKKNRMHFSEANAVEYEAKLRYTR